VGFVIEVDPKGNTWDIVAVPDAVKVANSTRGADIKGIMAEKGFQSPEANRIARYETRENIGKEVDALTLNERNAAADRALGFDAAEVVRDNQARMAPETRFGKIKQTIAQFYNNAIASHDAKAAVSLRDSPYLPKSMNGITQSPGVAMAHVALASAIQHHEQRHAGFKERDVLRYALNLQYEGVKPDTLHTIMDGLKDQGLVIAGTDGIHITTRDSLATEQRIIANIEQARGSAQPHVAKGDVAPALEPYLARDQDGQVMALNEGQMAAAELLLTTLDGVALIQGFSGTGKTSTLAPVAQAIAAYSAMRQREGQAVYGLAPSRQAVEQLEAVGLPSTTITKFLNENARALAGDEAAIQQARDKYAGAELIIDEASMISNRDFEQLTRLRGVIGLNKETFIGDKKQLQAVDAGKAFEWAQLMDVAKASLTSVVRQRVDDLKSFNELIRDGRVHEAFHHIRDRVVETDDFIKSASVAYLDMDPAQRAKTLVLTAGNDDRHRANALIQAGLREQGVLQGGGHKVVVYDGKNLTDAQLRDQFRYQLGDVLRVAVKSRSLGLARGDYDVIGKTRTNIIVRDGQGNTARFDPRGFAGQDARESISLMERRELTLYEGDKVRWTANENARGLTNGKQATITGIDGDTLTVETNQGETLELADTDPQARNLDLAYAVNAHKAQGATAHTALWAARAGHQLLTTVRQAYVNGTRSTHNMTVFTDSLRKLVETVGKSADVSGDTKPNGYKWASIEVTGQLQALQQAAAQRETLGAGMEERDPAVGPTLDGEEADIVARVMQMSDLDPHGDVDREVDLIQLDPSSPCSTDHPDQQHGEQDQFVSTLVVPQFDDPEPDRPEVKSEGLLQAFKDFDNFNRMPDGTLASPVIAPRSLDDLQRMADIAASWPEFDDPGSPPLEPAALERPAHLDLAESIEAAIVERGVGEGEGVISVKTQTGKDSEFKPPELSKDRDFDIDL
jgi:ATP-dependent exoDNAse (exonuclease V) alpha subunit